MLLEVEQDRGRLEHDKVVAVAVDEAGDAAVRVVLGVRWRLLLALGEVEEDGLVGEAELFEDERGFPEDRMWSATRASRVNEAR